jgi:dTDP-6-deoxy-L-talose 4-dehydrogenase (NAD+)
MIVAVTGGSGFIGGYVVQQLVDAGIKVIVTGTNEDKVRASKWFSQVEFIELDINGSHDPRVLSKIAASDKLIHLVWSRLPNYNELFHFEENLMPQFGFLKKLIDLGLKDITITGTCFEYGLKNGALAADTPTEPVTPYALAKDTLRKFLQQLQTKTEFKLKWARLFYLYGEGQSEKSILGQLHKALNRADTSFNMSMGEQLRDYLPVQEVAKRLIEISLDEEFDGVINCCSGIPISIRRLVESYLENRNKTIKLNLGYYPYPEHEPMAFWGVK